MIRRLPCSRCGEVVSCSPSIADAICGRCHTAQPRQQQVRRSPAPATLPGNILAEMLRQKGYTPRGCRCNEHIAQMNAWGIAGCRENIETIIDWLEQSAKQTTLRGKALHIPGLRGLGRHRLRALVEGALEVAETQL